MSNDKSTDHATDTPLRQPGTKDASLSHHCDNPINDMDGVRLLESDEDLLDGEDGGSHHYQHREVRRVNESSTSKVAFLVGVNAEKLDKSGPRGHARSSGIDAPAAGNSLGAAPASCAAASPKRKVSFGQRQLSEKLTSVAAQYLYRKQQKPIVRRRVNFECVDNVINRVGDMYSLILTLDHVKSFLDANDLLFPKETLEAMWAEADFKRNGCLEPDELRAAVSGRYKHRRFNAEWVRLICTLLGIDSIYYPDQRAVQQASACEREPSSSSSNASASASNSASASASSVSASSSIVQETIDENNHGSGNRSSMRSVSRCYRNSNSLSSTGSCEGRLRRNRAEGVKIDKQGISELSINDSTRSTHVHTAPHVAHTIQMSDTGGGTEGKPGAGRDKAVERGNAGRRARTGDGPVSSSCVGVGSGNSTNAEMGGVVRGEAAPSVPFFGFEAQERFRYYSASVEKLGEGPSGQDTEAEAAVHVPANVLGCGQQPWTTAIRTIRSTDKRDCLGMQIDLKPLSQAEAQAERERRVQLSDKRASARIIL